MIVIASAVPATAFETREECIDAASTAYRLKDLETYEVFHFKPVASEQAKSKSAEMLAANTAYESMIASMDEFADAIADVCAKMPS